MRAKFFAGFIAAGLVIPTASHAAWKFFNPKVEAEVPVKLSLSGFYSNWATKTVTPEANPYEVNSPSWSDFAHMYRWFILPPNTKVVYDDTSDYWDYPDGATFVQLFKLETVPSDASSAIFWETRVLVNKKDSSGMDEWFAFTYKWVPDGSEAHLIGASPDDSVLNVAMTFWPNGKNNPSSIRKWHYPDRNQCLQCHRTLFDAGERRHDRTILGFFTAQINRPSSANASVNQITEFFNKGLLTWKNKGTTQPTVGELAAMPRWYGITDSTQDINKRARAYLASNCSGCHGDRGITSGATMGARPNYDFYRGVAHQRLSTLELGSDYGIDGSRLVVPGSPEKSIVLFRQTERNSYAADVKAWNENTDPTRPAQPELAWYAGRFAMPPLGTFEVDTVAAKIMKQWILNFDVNVDLQGRPDAIRTRANQQSLRVPMMNANNIVIPEGMTGRVSLVGVNGREFSLNRVAGNTYAVPSEVKRGLYIVRVGAKSFTQYID